MSPIEEQNVEELQKPNKTFEFGLHPGRNFDYLARNSWNFLYSVTYKTVKVNSVEKMGEE